METNEKLMTLLRLMDEPEAMTEAQLEELLSDDEVRKTYELMADCKKVYKSEELRVKSEEFAAAKPSLEPLGTPVGNWLSPSGRRAIPSSLFTLHSSFLKIAAAFLGAIFLSGLAFAAWHTLSPAKDEQRQQPMAEANSSLFTHHSSLPSPVRFDDVRLDSILTVVAAHYGKTVSYRDEEPRAMKFITTWTPDDPLEAFIDHLNKFDYLRLTLQGDTIIVEHTEEEDAK